MMIARLSLVPVFALCLPLLSGCGSSSDGTTAVSGAAAGAPGTAGASQVGSAGTSGVAGSAMGAGGGSMTGAAGSASAGTGNVAGSAGAATSSGGMTGAAGNGSAGAAGAAGAAGTGSAMYSGATGQSMGCGKVPPSVDKIGSFAEHKIHITEAIDAQYLVGGKSYKNSGPYDFQYRPYAVRLPKGYDPTKSYPVILGGGGCGGQATDADTNPGGGYDIDNPREAIFVGLYYVQTCFADGGGGTNAMANTPEVPYVHEVLAEVKANYCVDQSRVFITGHSSGGWEAYTVGCALSKEIRGIDPVSGGLRLHRPPCQGPQASMMVEALMDTANPIGPTAMPSGDLDSYGSAPARDEILVRNGCVPADFKFTYTADNTNEAKAGNAPHTAWDPMYPDCVQYTGCPKDYPVVWCTMPGGHEADNDGKLSYIPAMLQFNDALPSH